jgi:hypothetical protein
MAGPDRRGSTELDRRASTWSSTHMSLENDSGGDDLASAGIADGFRPSNVIDANERHNHSQPIASPRNTVPPPRPLSTTKPKAPDAFALRHDGAMGHVGGNMVGGQLSDSRRSSRSDIPIETETFVGFDSPYQGPSGPSHPYQMYPQESRVARTMSMATTSTTRRTERSYVGPTGPTHPYGMYPQNTAEESASASGGPSGPVINVGFPGANNNYQRRIGPDGEEIADIIGPDGHTEQLPPYTKYPEVGLARKSRPVVRTSVSGAGGIGLATRNPEFSSQEDLSSPREQNSQEGINSPQSRQSIRSIQSIRSNPHEVLTRSTNADASSSEKPHQRKWQQVARRKICGIIPVWCIVLAATTLLLFGVILGATLAILKSKRPQDPGYDTPAELVLPNPR